MVKRMTANRNLDVMLEPGRVLVGNAGILVTKVVHEKYEGRRFVFVDAAMNDLIRPAMYDSWHEIVPVAETSTEVELLPADVVGPICETGDSLAKDRKLPQFSAGDLLAVLSAGAYGAVMASTYNSRPLIAEVMVRSGQYAVIRPRQKIQELIDCDQLPNWSY